MRSDFSFKILVQSTIRIEDCHDEIFYNVALRLFLLLLLFVVVALFLAFSVL